MTDEVIRSHLRKAIDEVAKKENARVSKILNDADSRIELGIEKMKPLIQLLNALREEVGLVKGLEIRPAEKGHMASIGARTSVTDNTLSISTNHDNSKYLIKESESFSIGGSFSENKREYETVEEVMAKVIDIVGKHLGSEKALSDRKGA